MTTYSEARLPIWVKNTLRDLRKKVADLQCELNRSPESVFTNNALSIDLSQIQYWTFAKDHKTATITFHGGTKLSIINPDQLHQMWLKYLKLGESR